MRPDQALSFSTDTLYNLARPWNVVNQCTALAGNHTSDVKIASFPRRRVLVPNLIHPGFQFALATQPSFCVAVAQQTTGVGSRPAHVAR